MTDNTSITVAILKEMVECYGGTDGGGPIDIIARAVAIIRLTEPDYQFEDY